MTILKNDTRRRPRLTVLLMCLCGGTWAVVVGGVALTQAFRLDDLPELLAIIAARLPSIFPLHMASGGLSLLLVPLTLVLRPWPRWHRLSGYATALSVLTGGITALVVAVYSASPLPARIGFFVQGLVWVGLLAAGLWAIRRGRVRYHRRFMLMMAAVTSGAMVFRLLLAGYTAWWPWADSGAFYSAIAWLGWLLPLGAVAGWEGVLVWRRSQTLNRAEI